MPRRILLVDDEPLILAAVARLLTIHGYDVATAESGDEALRWLELERADAVVTDWEMGAMDGTELRRRIHESTVPPPPIVLLSGSEPPEAERGNFAAVIRKSAPPAALLSELARLAELEVA